MRPNQSVQVDEKRVGYTMVRGQGSGWIHLDFCSGMTLFFTVSGMKVVVFLAIIPLISGKVLSGLNQDWRFSLVDAVTGNCQDDAFPIDVNDTQCNGLSAALYAFDAESCRDACCSSLTCAVWQWCTGDGDCGEEACWVGDIEDLSDDCQSQKGWVGQYRDELPPEPQPADNCNEEVMPECGGSNFNDTSWRILDVPHDFVVEGIVDQEKGDTSHGYLPVGSAWYRKHFKVSTGYIIIICTIVF